MSDIIIQVFALVVLLALTAAVAVIDWKTMIIPDSLTLALALSGLGFSLLLPVPGKLDAALSMVIGGAGAWGIREAYLRLRGRQGLGLGDVKFIAAAGAWTGTVSLAPMLFVSAVAALLYCGLRWLRDRPVGHAERLPFGPFLCAGLLIVAGLQIVLAVPAYETLNPRSAG